MAYSKEAQKIIAQDGNNENNGFLGLDEVFYNKKCLAGMKHVFIDQHGHIYRCVSGGRRIGNLHKGTLRMLKRAEVCRHKKCVCPTYGRRYVLEE